MKIKKQRGFALIEVLLAALVMVVGGVAYMKLQQTGLRYSYNNYMRVQGSAVATNFIEQLRGNVDIAANITADPNCTHGGIPCTKGTLVGLPQDTYNASVPANIKGAFEPIFKRQLEDVREQMKVVARNSVLCYLIDTDGFVRVTYRWADNNMEYQDKYQKEQTDKESKVKNFIGRLRSNALGLCPADFKAPVPDSNKEVSNMVSIYAQL